MMRNSLFSIFISIIFITFTKVYSQDIHFVQNEGQWKEDFSFKVLHRDADIYIEKSGMTSVVGAIENQEKIHKYKESILEEESILHFHAYKTIWKSANTNSSFEGLKKQEIYHNYFLGNDTNRWKGNVPVYLGVKQKDIYPNTDLHYYSNNGQLKYDIIVHPGGDPNILQFNIEGIEDIKIIKGNLHLQSSVGTIIENAPIAYQNIRGTKEDVKIRFKINSDGSIGFKLPSGYNKSYPLIIDPEIVFATMTGSTADNWGFSATYDEQGNLYAGGIANGTGYPTTLGAFQVNYGGGGSTTMPCDITITKFSPNGSSAIYSTYLGGSVDEMPHSLIVDNQGNLVIAGKTNSPDYPVTSNAYQSSKNGGYDIILSKISNDGSQLLASTYLGGNADDGVNISISYYADQNTLKYNYGDAFRSEVIVDNQNNIYLAGSTQSSNFPISSNAAKSNLGGNQDGVLVKMNAQLSQLIYSTFIGGGNDDAAYVLALDQNQQNIYVAGGTASNDFHNSLLNGLHTNFQGGLADGFILKFANSGNYPIIGGTYIGTSDYDQTYGIEVDLNDQVYIMGQTLGNFPVSNGVYSNPNSTQFVMKLPPSLNQITYSTVFGSGAANKPNISPVAFLVDTCENVYISGWASPQISPGSSTANMPITSNAFQSTTDNADFYFIVFSKNAQDLLLGSYFGAAGKSEHVDGGTARFDRKGVVYQSMCASCGPGNNFPATPGAYASQKGHSNCNLGAIKIAFNLGSVEANVEAEPDTSGCAPFTVQFQNNSSNATEYQWDFGDGNTSTSYEPSHTFTQAGTYQVRLVAHNPNACKEYDTSYVQIIVSDIEFDADFDYELFDICENPYITLQPNIQAAPGYNINDIDYFWDFGDGTTYSGLQAPNHYYNSPGTYQVSLTLSQDEVCNSPLTITKEIEIYPFDVEANFEVENPICVGSTISLINNSQNAESYIWTIPGIGNSSETNPNFTFDTPGTYSIKLVAANPESCNKIDSIEVNIDVLSNAEAKFSYTPNPPELNTPISFLNESPNGNTYKWDFGDGNHSSEEHPIHSYNRTGNYQVCLEASFDGMCPDIICKEIRVKVQSAADLPTAFSPNGDGENDILYVRGYNIEEIHLQIFNRWGQLVFESRDLNKGWDGTLNGTPQPMEVYGYSLQVKFLDGETKHLQGNVTLLR